jgi:type I restriction enzyme R subunit
MAEERGQEGVGTLKTRRFAVVIDEAHSSQGGETATDLKEVLGGEGLREEARKRAEEEHAGAMDELFRTPTGVARSGDPCVTRVGSP